MQLIYILKPIFPLLARALCPCRTIGGCQRAIFSLGSDQSTRPTGRPSAPLCCRSTGVGVPTEHHAPHADRHGAAGTSWPPELGRAHESDQQAGRPAAARAVPKHARHGPVDGCGARGVTVDDHPVARRGQHQPDTTQAGAAGTALGPTKSEGSLERRRS